MANLKNTNIDNNLELPSGTTGQRPALPQEGQIRYNTDLGVTEFYNGENWQPLSDTHPEATGGTVVDTDIGGVPYRIHYFTETGTDTLTVTNPGEVEYLIVAGGGAGASGDDNTGGGGGGGAGGLLTGTITVTPQSYTITVGDAGKWTTTGNQFSNANNDSGENSSAFGLTALGGGKGAGPPDYSSSGGNGGSGGGSFRDNGAGSGTAGQGNDGGEISSGSSVGGGGGGGAGTTGFPPNNTIGGNGGSPMFSLITGTSTAYAAGGGGGSHSVSESGKGGLSAGDGGGVDQDGTSATPNTGSGGGGGGNYSSDPGNYAGAGGNGGSGIVLVRYPRNSGLDSQPDRTVVATQPQNFQTVRDGLVLELDAGNPVSYPGSGTTVYNLGSGDITGNYVGDGLEFINEGPNKFSWRSFETPTDNPYSGITFGSPSAFDFGNNGAYTIAAWVKFYNYQQYSNILSKSDGVNLGSPYTWLHVVYNQGLASYDGSNWFRRGNDDGIRLNQWYYVTFAYDGSTMRHYVNGDEVASFSYSYSENTGHEVYTIASWTSATNDDHDFDGNLGLLHCYGRSLTDFEIKFIFNSTRNRYGI